MSSGRKTDQRGQILVFTALFMMTLIMSFLFMFNAGRMVTQRIKMQNAVDMAAHSAALWQARGLNLEGHLNAVQEGLFWASVGAAALLRWEIVNGLYRTSRKVSVMQDKVATLFPGIAVASSFLSARQNGADASLPLNSKMVLTLGIKKGTKIPLVDEVLKKIPMDKIPKEMKGVLNVGAYTKYKLDTPKYWSPQERNGIYFTLIAYKYKPEIFAGGLLGVKSTPISTVATARPKYKKGKLEDGEVKAGWGASLMPVTLPGKVRNTIMGALVYH